MRQKRIEIHSGSSPLAFTLGGLSPLEASNFESPGVQSEEQEVLFNLFVSACTLLLFAHVKALRQDEERITWERGLSQLICSSLFLSQFHSLVNQHFSSHPGCLFINFYNAKMTGWHRGKRTVKAQDFPEESKMNRAQGSIPAQGIQLHIQVALMTQ